MFIIPHRLFEKSSTAASKKTAKSIQKIGVLTSGGDAPGMNAAIRAVVRMGIAQGRRVVGIQRGYAGLIEGEVEPMSLSSVANIVQRGGTILRTSRSPEFQTVAGRKKAIRVIQDHSIDALVVIGGDGSFRGAAALLKEHKIPILGVPGTIDNDIFGTEDTIGFDTAVNTAIESIDRIRDTASSHDRIFLVEVMGRNSGMIALCTGIGGGAESIVIPEVKTSIQKISKFIDRGVRRGKTSSIIVVAEGCQFNGAEPLRVELEKRGYSAKLAILGHTQRGGRPSAHDRMLASILGALSVQALLTGVREGMVGVSQGRVSLTSFQKTKRKPPADLKKMLEIAQNLSI